MKEYLYYFYGPTLDHAGYYSVIDSKGEPTAHHQHKVMEEIFMKNHTARQEVANEQ